MYLYICDWKLRGISLTVYVTQTISDYIRGSGRSFLPIRYCCRRYLLDQRNMLPPETRKIWRGFDWWVLMFWNELSIPAFMTACAYRTWGGGGGGQILLSHVYPLETSGNEILCSRESVATLLATLYESIFARHLTMITSFFSSHMIMFDKAWTPLTAS